MSRILEIVRIFEKENPNPITELDYINNYTLLISILLSARTTDKQVNKVTKDLFKIIQSPKDVLEIGESELGKKISTIGLWKNKASNIIKLSQMLIDDFGGDVPCKFDDLIKLPGIGSKSANAFLNVAFEMPTMPVDTHVFRVSNRIGIVKAKNVDLTEKELLKIIPQEYISKMHHWLVLHGRYVCKARNPMCYLCNISKYCDFFVNNKNI